MQLEEENYITLVHQYENEHRKMDSSGVVVAIPFNHKNTLGLRTLQRNSNFRVPYHKNRSTYSRLHIDFKPRTKTEVIEKHGRKSDRCIFLRGVIFKERIEELIQLAKQERAHVVLREMDPKTHKSNDWNILKVCIDNLD